MYDRTNALLESLLGKLYERELPIRLGLLTALAGESLFLLGKPGTGKSLIARRLHQAFAEAKTFSYLMGRFSTPDEVFGPISIQRLRDEDRYERRTENYLPDADVVFLDEIWKASPPIQNALLTALNERIYRNGTAEIELPLKVFVGASNELPEDQEETAAFWDRFLVRLVVEPIETVENLHRLLTDEGDPYHHLVANDIKVSSEEYAAIQEKQRHVQLSPNVLDLLTAIRAELAAGTEESEPIYVSDRRWKKIAKLLRVSALLHGRTSAEPLDCSIIRHCAWTTLAERERVNEVVDSQLASRAGSRELSELTAARLEELRTAYEQMRVEEREIEAARPTYHRDEYYRLLPEGVEATDEELILVWHGDIDELSLGRSETIDIFFYDAQGQLTGSEQVDAKRSGEWTLRCEEQVYTIETAIERTTRREERKPKPAELASIASEVSALLAEVDGHVEELLEAQRQLEDAGHQHLFVSAADTSVVLNAVTETLDRLSELRVLVQDLLAQVSAR
ncbi:MAG: AAA family ATPase [Spirochaetales bacterium]